MYSDRKKGHGLLVAVIILLLFSGGLFAVLKPEKPDERETMESIKQTVMERSLQCYVVEGAYPPDLEYLEDNYGLAINRKDYYVHFEAYAENQPPQVRVTTRNRT